VDKFPAVLFLSGKYCVTLAGLWMITVSWNIPPSIAELVDEPRSEAGDQRILKEVEWSPVLFVPLFRSYTDKLNTGDTRIFGNAEAFRQFFHSINPESDQSRVEAAADRTIASVDFDHQVVVVVVSQPVDFCRQQVGVAQVEQSNGNHLRVTVKGHVTDGCRPEDFPGAWRESDRFAVVGITVKKPVKVIDDVIFIEEVYQWSNRPAREP